MKRKVSSYNCKESEVTDETLFINRRSIIKQLGILGSASFIINSSIANSQDQKTNHKPNARKLLSYKRDAIIREATKDLAETQVEKLKKLAENVDFEDEETFTQKVAQLKESYFAKKITSQEGEIVEDDTPSVETSDSMASYLNAIKKTQTK